jgi:GDPmannose 4,6-dehydratase
MKKIALIVGGGGQDGTYLCEFLLNKKYIVISTSRNNNAASSNHINMGISDQVNYIKMNPEDFGDTFKVLQEVKPHEIYNLSGQSSVGKSFLQPVETINSIALATLNILESLRLLQHSSKIYNASSSECFGDIGEGIASEITRFLPKSPYGIAKVASHHLAVNYRESYEIFASNGILFNHESPLRNENFVTQKIVYAAARISKGYSSELTLGNIDITRDWGWAPDYVEAMWQILESEKPSDYIVSTGESHELKNFIEKTFSFFNLDWENYTKISTVDRRPNDIKFSKGDPSKIFSELGWKSSVSFDQLICKLCSYADEKLRLSN